MSDHLLKPTVLVLNRNWQAINTRTPIKVFPMLATNVVTAVDIDEGRMVATTWDSWIKLPVRPHDQFVQTPHAKIRIPTVIICAKFSRIPPSAPKFSSRGVKERDKYTCQYCEYHSNDPTEFNLDHVVPRKLDGKTEWTNIVCSCIPCNTKKGHKTLEESGMKLLRQPFAPKKVPISHRLVNTHGVADWTLFGYPPHVKN